jgi:NAD-dependent deacetylase
MTKDQQLKEVAQAAAEARRIMVSTGAGVSAESGVPTFRDAQTGLWAKFDPVMLASVEGFTADPENVWRWYDARRVQMRAAAPNPGHLALAAWQAEWRRRGLSFDIATQNIDDLHNRAGALDVIELHGNVDWARPLSAPHSEARRLPDPPLPQLPPRDERGRLLRPHVVWFGEMLDDATLNRALELSAACDLFILAGSSNVVYPAAALPLTALQSTMERLGRAVVVEINPEDTEITPLVQYALRGKSGEVLPELWELVQDSS